MSKQFSQFPGGNPPADTDRFLIGRVDGASPTGFSNFIMTWAQIKAAIGGGGNTYNITNTNFISSEDGIDGEDGFTVPGSRGADGIGTPGATGKSAPFMLPEAPDDPEEPILVPGAKGATGSIGPSGTGVPGSALFYLPDAPDEPDEPAMIRGPQGPAGGGGGSLTLTGGEVNVGTTPVFAGKFTLVDAAITSASKILIFQAPGPYTGKGTLADESEMDKVTFTASPGTGQATVYWRTQTQLGMRIPDGEGKASAVTIPTTDDQQIKWTPLTIGRIRGNIKYLYALG